MDHIEERTTPTKTTAALTGLSRMMLLVMMVPATCCCNKDEDERIRKAQEKARAETRRLIAKHAPVIDAKVKNARATEGMLSSIPPAEPDAKVPTLKPPIKIMERHMDAADATADVMFESEVGSLKRGILGSCSVHLARGNIPDYLAEDILPRCARVRYLLVVRPTTYAKPRLDDKTRTYTGGTVQGDVVIFELKGTDPARSLGSFPIAAQLPAQVQVDSAISHKQYEINEQLRRAVLEAIEKKLLPAR